MSIYFFFSFFFCIFERKHIIIMKDKSKQVLAYLKDVDVATIIENHITYYCDMRGNPKPSKVILKQKYQYMLHLIITRCKYHQDGICYLNAQFYRDQIFNDQFSDMIATLRRLSIIKLKSYVPKKHSKVIHLLDWNIGYRIVSNKRFLKWEEALKKWKPTPKYEPNKFTDHYNNCLKCLRLIDKEGAQKYINDNIKDKSTLKYHRYSAFVNEFNADEMGIYSIDEQNRIYHFLTSLPRKLRKYYNIKYELDVANSHPLLLNEYLINNYNINNDILLQLYGNSLYHYDGEYLSKLLRDNNIEIGNIPIDVIEYIAKTQHGKFYDDFVVEFGNIKRDKVKKKVFSQVFYSHIDDVYVTKFCMAFMKRFPNVWKVIYNLKEKTNDKLPHLMMKNESMLFRPIIEECWRRGWKVVNLHDALIVFDVKENEAVDVEELKSIIKAVYNKHNLYPTIKLEIGSE